MRRMIIRQVWAEYDQAVTQRIFSDYRIILNLRNKLSKKAGAPEMDVQSSTIRKFILTEGLFYSSGKL